MSSRSISNVLKVEVSVLRIGTDARIYSETILNVAKT